MYNTSFDSIRFSTAFKMLKKAVRFLIIALFFVTPYLGILFDRLAYSQRGYMAFGGEWLIPLMGQLGMLALMDFDTLLNRRNNK